VIVLFVEPPSHFRRFFLIPFTLSMRPSTVLPMGRHHSSPSPSPFLLLVRTAQPQKPPLRTAEAQDAIDIIIPYPAALTPTHDILERQRSIANARRRFMPIAVCCSTLRQHTWDLMKLCDATMDWTVTVLDKWNTAPVFAFTTPTVCLAYSIAPSQPLPFFTPFSYRSCQVACTGGFHPSINSFVGVSPRIAFVASSA
jgi:hypothetical protein